LRRWSKIKNSELHLLTLEVSLGQAIGRLQHTPGDTQRAAQALVKYAHEEKLELFKSKDFSQFNASSLPIVAEMVGAFESLAQIKDRECGGTTTYYAMGSEVGEQEPTGLGQASTSGQ
jgi:nicotinamide mononucleotide (NMN) deamidase PncC